METNKKIKIFENLYNFLFLLQQLIDRGETANIDEVVDACDRGNVVGYIKTSYDLEGLDLLPFTSLDLLNELYKESSLISLHDVSKRYKLNNNGLIYLVSVGISKLFSEVKTLRGTN